MSLWQTLAQEYGCYLKEKNRHDEAGIVFARAELWQMAFDAFVAALDWRKAFCMAARLQLDAIQIAEMGRKLAGESIVQLQSEGSKKRKRMEEK